MSDLPRRASRRFSEFLDRRASWVLLGLVASLLVSGLLSARLAFDFSPQAIYRGDDNLVADAEEFRRTFGYDDAVVLVVLETEPGKVMSPEALAWQRAVSSDLADLEPVSRVTSLATLQVPRPTFTGLSLAPLVPETLDEQAAEQVRIEVAEQPLIRQGLVSDDLSTAAVFVFLRPNGRDFDSMQRTVKALRETVARHAAPAGAHVHLSGLPAIRVEIVERLRGDLVRLMPVAGLVYLVALWVIYQKADGAVLPLAAVTVGVAWTMAFFAATGEPINLVSNVLPILLVIIGVSSAVQIVSCYGETFTAHPEDRRKAAREAIERMAPACLLAGLTTSVGFASLATARSVLLQRFGWQAAAGVALQYAGTLVALGAMFRYFAPPPGARPRDHRPGPLVRLMGAAGAAIARHPLRTLGGGALVVAASIWAGTQVKINSYALLETFSEDAPALRVLRLVEDRLKGILPLEILLEAEGPECFLEPEVYHAVLRFEELARAEPGVLAVQSYADLYREIVAHWPGRRVSEPDEVLVPEGRTGQVRLERAARFVDEFPEAFHIDTFLSPDRAKARIQIRLREIGSRQTLTLLDRFEAALAEAFPAEGCVGVRMTGEAYVNARALTKLIRDLTTSLLTAAGVIFGLIALEFRSLRAGLIAAVPNLTPLCVTLGYMGLRGYDMNVGNVIVFTISLGLADDNTIHFLYRFREELRAGGDVPSAIRRAFEGTGRAIVTAAALLVVGLIVLLFSSFVPTRRFAELTTVTVLGNLLGVLLLLPACLALFWKRSEGSRLPPSGAENASSRETGKGVADS